MKVKIIKNSLDNKGGGVMNADMKDYIATSTLFYAFGIRISKSATYIYIFNGNHLFEVPIDFFEIIEDRILTDWRIKVWSDGDITLWPDLFYQEGFIENFAEREFNERSMFEALRRKVEC